MQNISLNTFLNKIMDSENSNLEFLKPVINLRNTIQQKFGNRIIKVVNVDQIPLEYRDYNAMCLPNDEIGLIDSNTCDEIFSFIKDYNEKQIEINNLNNFDKKTEHKPLHEEITSFFKEIKDKNRYKHLLTQLQIDPEIAGLTIFKQIQNAIIIDLQKIFKNNMNELHLKYTSLLTVVGSTIFLLYLQENFKLLFDVCVNKKANINQKDWGLFNELVIAILNEDKQKYNLIYHLLCSSKSTLNESIISILNYYIECFILKKVHEHEMDFNTKVTSFLNQKYPNKNYYEGRLKILGKLHEEFVKLGSPLFLWLQEFKLIDIKMKTEKEDQAYYVYFKDEFLLKYMQAESMRIPYLNLSNLKDESTNIILQDIQLNFNDNQVHAHREFETIVTSKTYLSDNNENPHSIQLGIDDQNLCFFLQKLSEIINKKHDEVSEENLQWYLNLFDIDFYKEFKNSKNYSDFEQEKSSELLNIALDFSKISNSKFLSDIKEEKQKNENHENHTPNKVLNKYRYLYSRILSYKVLFLGLIKSAILFSLFGYFLLKTFLDSRGRLYLQGFYLNIQSFPIIKAFIKLYDPTKTTLYKNFYKIKQVLSPLLKHETTKKALKDLTYESCTEETNKITLDYILKEFKEVSKEDLINFIETKPDINQIWSFTQSYIKKPNKFMNQVSFLYRAIYPHKYLTDLIGLDASNSGLQMISMLFRLKDIGTYTNLITDEPNSEYIDIYNYPTRVSISVFKQIEIILDDMKNKCKIKLYQERTPVLTKNFNESTSISELLTLFINFDLKWVNYNFYELCNILHKKIKISNLILMSEDKIHDLEFIIPSKEKKLIEKIIQIFPDIRRAITPMFILRNAIFLTNLMNKCGLDYKNDLKRAAWKSLVMTYPYNATSFRRKEKLIEYFETLSHVTVSKHLYILAEYLELIFQQFIKIYLNSAENLIKLSKIISFTDSKKEKLKPLKINTRFLEIMFHPNKTCKKIIETKNVSNSRAYRLVFKIPMFDLDGSLIIDKSLMRQKVGPNLIHMMDANLVHLFNQRLFEANISFNFNKDKIFLNSFTNHDTFYFSIYGLIRILVRDCYYQIYDWDFFSIIIRNLRSHLTDRAVQNLKKKSNDPNYLPQNFNNDFFIKV